MDKRKITIIGAAVVVAAAIYAFSGGSDEPPLVYTLGEAEVGNIESIVITSGTLAALNTVVVGSQLSGQISELQADFNSPVSAGQLLARIDPRTFEARVQQNKAEVEIAEANIASQEAALVKAQVARREAAREKRRREQLIAQGHVSASELDQDIAALETADAQIKIAEAQLFTARANLTQRKAALQQSELDLERTYIRSPVDGTVIERNIELGQTVAASLQAPNLFTIAQDLHEMEVEASVDEADIGQVREGLICRFTVDAFPERSFNGRINQIRKAPNVVQNVVTYKVMITADNSDLALLPGMTANVEIIRGRKEGVLKIPNAALRFAPKREEEEASGAPGLLGQFMPRMGPPRGFMRNRNPNSTAPNSGATGSRQFGGEGGNPMAIMERLDGADFVSDSERAEVRALFEAQRKQMGSLFGSGMSREEMRARMQASREQMMKALAKILSEEQLARLGIGPNQPRGRPATVWTLDESGEPVARQIVIGLGDDQSTEVISGLEAGDEVITRASRSRA